MEGKFFIADPDWTFEVIQMSDEDTKEYEPRPLKRDTDQTIRHMIHEEIKRDKEGLGPKPYEEVEDFDTKIAKFRAAFTIMCPKCFGSWEIDADRCGRCGVTGHQLHGD